MSRLNGSFSPHINGPAGEVFLRMALKAKRFEVLQDIATASTFENLVMRRRAGFDISATLAQAPVSLVGLAVQGDELFTL
jgi:hypothetical protein